MGFCTEIYSTPPKLRFACGDRVAFRIEDSADGLDQWLCGQVKETWSKLEGPHTFDGVKFAMEVPYLLEADSSESLSELCYYCHKDDHTLIRKENHAPQTRTRGIAKRMEKRLGPDGTFEMFDHVTLRRKTVVGELEDSDE